MALHLLDLIRHSPHRLILSIPQLLQPLLVLAVDLVPVIFHHDIVLLPLLQPHVHHLEFPHSACFCLQVLFEPLGQLVLHLDLSLLPALHHLHQLQAVSIIFITQFDRVQSSLNALHTVGVISLNPHRAHTALYPFRQTTLHKTLQDRLIPITHSQFQYLRQLLSWQQILREPTLRLEHRKSVVMLVHTQIINHQARTYPFDQQLVRFDLLSPHRVLQLIQQFLPDLGPHIINQPNIIHCLEEPLFVLHLFSIPAHEFKYRLIYYYQLMGVKSKTGTKNPRCQSSMSNSVLLGCFLTLQAVLDYTSWSHLVLISALFYYSTFPLRRSWYFIFKGIQSMMMAQTDRLDLNLLQKDFEVTYCLYSAYLLTWFSILSLITNPLKAQVLNLSPYYFFALSLFYSCSVSTKSLSRQYTTSPILADLISWMKSPSTGYWIPLTSRFPLEMISSPCY